MSVYIIITLTMPCACLCAAYYHCEPKDLAPQVVGACGGTAGVLYWLACFPVDVIKSAMMGDAIDPTQRKYPNMISTAKVGGGGWMDGLVGWWVGAALPACFRPWGRPGPALLAGRRPLGLRSSR